MEETDMLNIIRADFFRVRKGAAIKGVFIGLIALVILLAYTFNMVSNNLGDQGYEGSGISFTVESNERTIIESIANGGAFLLEMTSENGIFNALPIFLLPLFIAVFGADYSAGTFRNLLSHESDRKKVYMAKLLLMLPLTLLMLLVLALTLSLSGGLLYGFAGFTGDVIGKVLCTFLLQMPIYLALICLGHFLLVFTKKSSRTIAIYLIGLFALDAVLQIFLIIRPQWVWLANLDLVGALNRVAGYQVLPVKDIVMSLVFAGVVAIVTFMVGMLRYQTTDFDFT
jgi:ABC-type transport system involved in multi-copper enzyme maturation permease subunit